MPTRSVPCQSCYLRERCLPRSLVGAELEAFGGLVRRRGPIKRGTRLFRAGEPFEGLYAVQAGSMKAYGRAPGGQQQITAFYYAGDVLGMDAIQSGCYPYSASALEESWVCSLPYGGLEDLMCKTPRLQRAVVSLMSRQLATAQNNLMTVAKFGIEQQLQRFLKDVQLRSRRRLADEEAVVLSMSRSEIASYLGSTAETVCRGFTRLRAEGLIELNGRTVRLSGPLARR